MAMRDSLLAEFDEEATRTRAAIAALTDEAALARPHPRNWTNGELALHLVQLLVWQEIVLSQRQLDVADPAASQNGIRRFEGAAALVARLEKALRDARGALAMATDRELEEPFALLAGEREILRLPRAQCLRTFVWNHLVHHRGQLLLCLRLCGVPTPPLYGPTADG